MKLVYLLQLAGSVYVNLLKTKPKRCEAIRVYVALARIASYWYILGILKFKHHRRETSRAIRWMSDCFDSLRADSRVESLRAQMLYDHICVGFIHGNVSK